MTEQNSEKLNLERQELTQKLATQPNDKALIGRRAIVNYQLGQLAAAFIDAQALISQGVESAFLFLVMAVAQFDKQDLASAKTSVHKCIEIETIQGSNDSSDLPMTDADRAMAQYLMSEIFLEEGKTDMANQAITRAIGLNSSNALFYSTRADVRQELGEFDQAVSDLDIAVKLAPDNFEFLLDRVEAMIHAKKVDQAIKEIGAALKLVKGAADNELEVSFLNLRAEAYLTMGDDLRARAEFKKVTQVAADDPRANLGLVDIAVRTRDFAMAEKYLVAAAKGDADEEELSLLKGILEHARENFKQAFEAFQKTLRINDQNPAAYFYLSLVKKQLGLPGFEADAAKAKELGFVVQF